MELPTTIPVLTPEIDRHFEIERKRIKRLHYAGLFGTTPNQLNDFGNLFGVEFKQMEDAAEKLRIACDSAKVGIKKLSSTIDHYNPEKTSKHRKARQARVRARHK
jgi:hypothetical protein